MAPELGKNLKIALPAENSRGFIAPEMNQSVKVTMIVGAGIKRKSPTTQP